MGNRHEKLALGRPVRGAGVNRLPSAVRGPGLRVWEDIAPTNNVTAGTGASCGPLLPALL